MQKNPGLFSSSCKRQCRNTEEDEKGKNEEFGGNGDDDDNAPQEIKDEWPRQRMLPLCQGVKVKINSTV